MTMQLVLFTPAEVKAAPSKMSQEGADIWFNQFWQVYPKRVGSNPKKPAKEKFCRLVMIGGVLPQDIIAGTAAYARSRDGEDARFTAMATTFLNQHRWEDDHGPGRGPRTFAELSDDLRS